MDGVLSRATFCHFCPRHTHVHTHACTHTHTYTRLHTHTHTLLWWFQDRHCPNQARLLKNKKMAQIFGNTTTTHTHTPLTAATYTQIHRRIPCQLTSTTSCLTSSRGPTLPLPSRPFLTPLPPKELYPQSLALASSGKPACWMDRGVRQLKPAARGGDYCHI